MESGRRALKDASTRSFLSKIVLAIGNRGEQGFTLVELAIASGVMATSLAMLAGVMTSGLTATGYARERQAASQLANRTLEQIRALAFDTVKAGLDSTDLASAPDSNITGSACGNYSYGGEQIACGANPNSGAPLVPHKSTVTVGPTGYTVASYVTYYNNVTTADARRVTVIVSWTSPLKGNQAVTLQVQTIMYSSAGGYETRGQHPFPGPNQPLFNGNALQTAGSLNISGTVDGVGLDHATLWTSRATSDGSIEQTSRIEGLAQGSGAGIQATGGTEQTIGRSSVTSRADNDNGSTLPVYDTQSLPAPSSANVAVTFNSDSLTTSMTAGDTGSTTSTTSACTTSCAAGSSPNPRNCPNITGLTNENDSLQCGGSVAKTGATLSAVASLGPAGATTLASTAAATSGPTATFDYNTAPGAGKCLGTSGDGCARSQVSRSAGPDLNAGGLPANLNALLKPVGFTSLVQITGISDTVTAEAGGGAAVPVATQSAGSVKVWCGTAIIGDLLCPVTGYVTKTFAQLATIGATASSVLTITDPLLGGGTTISLSAAIKPGSTATASTPATATTSCPATCLTSATATSTPPVVTVTYSITIGGVSHLNTAIVLDPGAITAKATYAPAPA